MPAAVLLLKHQERGNFFPLCFLQTFLKGRERRKIQTTNASYEHSKSLSQNQEHLEVVR